MARILYSIGIFVCGWVLYGNIKLIRSDQAREYLKKEPGKRKLLIWMNVMLAASMGFLLYLLVRL